MTSEQKKQPKEPLRITLGFEETLEAMLQVRPEPSAKKPPIKKPAVKKTATRAKK